jgi:glycosyl transferase family 25
LTERAADPTIRELERRSRLLPVFVINLALSEDRRRHSEDQLAALGLGARFVAACDGATLDLRDPEIAAALAPRPYLGRALSPTELATLRSHMGVYERIVGEELPAACILEDDCALSADLVPVLQAVDRYPGGWDVMLLGHYSARHDPTEGVETCYRGAAIAPGRRVARVAEFPMGAYAYVVTSAGAGKLLRYARPLRMPADWVTGYSPAMGVRLYAVTPPCVTPHPAVAVRTTIGGREGLAEPALRPAGPVWSVHSALRAWAGRLLLQSRKLGLAPDGYVKRF